MSDAALPKDKRANPIQVLAPGTSASIDTSATSARAALPPEATIAMLSTTQAAWIAFGDSNVAAVVKGSGSFLLPGGGVNLQIPGDATHYAAIQSTLAGTVCLTRLY